MIRCLGCMKEYDEEYEVCPYCGYIHGSKPKEAFQLNPGVVLRNRYIVGKVIGNGGFGITYIGWDNILQHKIAIKEYFPGEFSTRVSGQTKISIFSGEREEQFISGKEKFIEEAQRLAKFNQTKGIVHVSDFFEENNTAYIIMEYLEGETYKEKLKRRGVIPVEEARTIIIEVLEALKAVHSEGLIHRDIAPDNIMLTNKGEVTILDFGASRYATTKHSKSLSIILKSGYAPEEQYQSRGNQGPWTDIYAVAATFYKMITGITPQASIERGVKDNVKRPSKLGVSIPRNLENAIMNALNVRIEDRTQSVDEFLTALHADKVKRKREKLRIRDVGKLPLWLKISLPVMTVAAISVLGLMLSGVIHFDIKNPLKGNLEAGMVRVPNVVNMSYEEAEELLNESNLKIHIIDRKVTDNVKEDTILSQDIQMGELLSENSVINVVVSKGEEIIRYPDVLGISQDKAIEMYSQNNIPYEIYKVYSDFAPGEIVYQSVTPNDIVNAEENVLLLVSDGLPQIDSTKTVKMQDFVGMRYDDARKILLENNLFISKDEIIYDETIPYGYILSQNIEKNQEVSLGNILGVKVNMAKGRINVPNYVGQSARTAIQELKDLYFNVTEVSEYSDTVAAGNIISTDPTAHMVVDVGADMTVVTSKGKEPKQNTGIYNQYYYKKDTTAPNVVGLSVGDAVKRIYEWGLIPFYVGEWGDPSSKGVVIRQDPAEGQPMKTGDYLTFVYNRGSQSNYEIWIGSGSHEDNYFDW